jgi:hypothetical protein
MDIQTVNAPSRRGIAQALQSRTDQGSATVAIVKKLHRRWDDKPIRRDALAQGSDLAGNGVRFGLLLRGYSSVQSGLDRVHNGILLPKQSVRSPVYREIWRRSQPKRLVFLT